MNSFTNLVEKTISFLMLILVLVVFSLVIFMYEHLSTDNTVTSSNIITDKKEVQTS